MSSIYNQHLNTLFTSFFNSLCRSFINNGDMTSISIILRYFMRPIEITEIIKSFTGLMEVFHGFLLSSM